MTELENDGTGKCRYWKMTVLEMPVLENAGTENASTGKCRNWKMPVLEIGNTGKCQYRSVAIQYFGRL